MSFGQLSRLGGGFSRSGALGGSSTWAPTFSAFKTYLAAFDPSTNPHALSVMPSPPTITTSTANLDATYARQLNLSTTADVTNSILIEGGKQALTATVFEQPYASTISSGVFQKVCSRVSVNASADVVAFYVIGSALPYRFLVDGRYVDMTGTIPAATTGTGTNWIILTFGSKATRKVTIELQQGQALRKIAVKTADAWGTKPASSTFRMCVLGDSIAASTAATHFGDGFVPIMGDYLGIPDTWPSGVGSTGYVNTASGTRYKLSQRLLDANANGLWDIIDICIGINDLGLSGIQAEAATCFDSLRSSNPKALIGVTGPWDSGAPSAPSSDYTAAKTAIQAAMAGRGGFYWFDPQGTSYTKFDAVHPDTAGHTTLAAWKVAQWRAALGL